MNTPPHQLTTDGDSAETRSPAAPLLTFGSIAAFVLGLVCVPATVFVALIWLIGRSLPSGCSSDGLCIEPDSPAVSHDRLVQALSVGGLGIALLAFAVLLGVVVLLRNRVPLRPARVLLAACAATTAAAFALAPFHATRTEGIGIGIVSFLCLVVCWAQIDRTRRRVRRSEP